MVRVSQFGCLHVLLPLPVGMADPIATTLTALDGGEGCFAPPLPPCLPAHFTYPVSESVGLVTAHLSAPSARAQLAPLFSSAL